MINDLLTNIKLFITRLALLAIIIISIPLSCLDGMLFSIFLPYSKFFFDFLKILTRVFGQIERQLPFTSPRITQDLKRVYGYPPKSSTIWRSAKSLVNRGT